MIRLTNTSKNPQESGKRFAKEIKITLFRNLNHIGHIRHRRHIAFFYVPMFFYDNYVVQKCKVNQYHYNHSVFRFSTGFALAADSVCDKTASSPKNNKLIRLTNTSKNPQESGKRFAKKIKITLFRNLNHIGHIRHRRQIAFSYVPMFFYDNYVVQK
ncbi:hypothetical protein [Pollutibacter soli]|uniref:hypothetical protein n=1 Tax=Pollutibacter soli TaxID=3034157 RepID=UPI0030140596